MKKLIHFAVITAMLLLLAACGAQKNELDIGYGLVQKDDCAGAAPYLDHTIAAPESIMDLAYAFFLKARCAEKGGDLAGAYENFYAAKVVACYAVAHDTHVNLNTYGRSEFCQVRIPAILDKIEPKIGADKAKELKAKVDGKLHARYLERFAKPQ